MKIINEVLIRLPQCNSKLCQSEAFQKGSLPLVSFIVNEIAFARIEQSKDPIENSKTRCLKIMTWSVLMSVGLIVKEKQGLVAANFSLGAIGGIVVIVQCIGKYIERRKKAENQVTLNKTPPQPPTPPNTPASAPVVLPSRQQLPSEPASSTQTTASAPVTSSAQKPPLVPSNSTQSIASAPELSEHKHQREESFFERVFKSPINKPGDSSISKTSTPSSNSSPILSPNSNEEGDNKRLIRGILKIAAKTGPATVSNRFKKFKDGDHQTIASLLLENNAQTYIEGFFKNADLELQKKVWLQLKEEDSSKVWKLLPKDLKNICIPLDTKNFRLDDLINFPNVTEVSLINSSVKLWSFESIESLLAKGIKVNLEQKNSKYFDSAFTESDVPESLMPKWKEQQEKTIARNGSLASPFNVQSSKPSLMQFFAENEEELKKGEEAKAKADAEKIKSANGKRKHRRKHRTPQHKTDSTS